MKINTIEYPKCPHCGLLVNNMNVIPASLLFDRFGTEMNCPKCKLSFGIESKVTLVFETYKLDKVDEVKKD